GRNPGMEVWRCGLLVGMLLLMAVSSAEAQLGPSFYQLTCPNVESIVRQAVVKKLSQTFVTVPATLRLFFHDCFVEVSPNLSSDFMQPFPLLHLLLIQIETLIAIASLTITQNAGHTNHSTVRVPSLVDQLDVICYSARLLPSEQENLSRHSLAGL
ncbi:hypothetical protein BHE74_00059433, partial [Ensete ventricosum]